MSTEIAEKEKRTNKNHSNDNYSYSCYIDDTIINQILNFLILNVKKTENYKQ